MVTVAVEPVEEKPVETVKAVMVNLLVEVKLLVVPEDQESQAHPLEEEMETQEELNTHQPWTAEEVVPATSVVKVVLLMLVVVLVDPDTVKDKAASTLKVPKVVLLVKVLPLLQMLINRTDTSQAVVKVDVVTVETVASQSLTMVKLHSKSLNQLHL